MKNNILLGSLISLLLLSGCNSTVSVSMNQSRLHSPEVNSKPLKVNLSTGINSRHEVTFQEQDNEDIEPTLFLQGDVTVGKGLAVYVKDSSDSILNFGIKYQFAGDHSDVADKGNFSQAISIGYETKTTRNGNKDYLTTTTQPNGSPDVVEVSPDDVNQCSFSVCNSYWESDTKILDIGWILGYRLNKQTLLYGGPFYQRGDMDLVSTRENDARFDGSTGRQLGLSFATEYRFEFGLAITGELVYTDTKWESFKERAPSYGLKIDYQF